MQEKKITLIEGSFSAEEAYELLTKLLHDKIKFHARDEFSKSIRNVEQPQQSLKRIDALMASLESVQEFLKDSKERGETIKIYSEIHIEREA